MTPLSLACGLTLRWMGDDDLAEWARLGARVWFVAAPGDSRAAAWDVIFERDTPTHSTEGAPRWLITRRGEECATAWGAVILRPERRECRILMPDRRAMGHLIHLALGAMLRHEGRLQLHAAGLSRGAALPAVLIAGPSGSGKTTVTLNLARRGWMFLSDDSVALTEREGGFDAAPVRLRFMQKSEGMRSKVALDPEVGFEGQRLRRAEVGALLFLEHRRACLSSLSPVSRIEALSRLPALTPGFGPSSGRSQVRALAKLASLPAFVLQSGVDVPQGGGSLADALGAFFPEVQTALRATIEPQPETGVRQA